jgi:N-acetylneuraminic acid mutarotase
VPGAAASGATTPLAGDTDGARHLDGAECALTTSPLTTVTPAASACGATTDSDGDGVLDYREYCHFGTDSATRNGDGDACDDGKEVASINGDATVTSLDLSQVAQSFGPSTGPNYIVDFDVIRDGTITSLDLGFVAQRFGACPTGTWTGLAPLPAGPRQETGVAALGSEVFVVGGFNAGSTIVATVEAYDATDDTWRTTAPVPVAMHHANTAALGGKLYVVGFLTGAGFAADGRVYEYDPGADSWTPKASMPAGTERGASGVAVVGTKIYVAGGFRAGVAVDDFSAYDTATNTWQTLPDVPSARDHLVAGAIDGIVIAAGGRNGTITGHFARVDAYDPLAGTWTPRAPMPTSRGGAAGAVSGGRLYVIGGEGSGSGSGVFAQAEVYHAASGYWTTLTPMVTPRHGTGAAVVGSAIIVPGGATVQGFGAVATNEGLSPPPP